MERQFDGVAIVERDPVRRRGVPRVARDTNAAEHVVSARTVTQQTALGTSSVHIQRAVRKLHGYFERSTLGLGAFFLLYARLDSC